MTYEDAAELHRELDELLAENDKLKDENDKLRDTVDRLESSTNFAKNVAEAINLMVRDSRLDPRAARGALIEVMPTIPWIVNRRGLIEVCHASEPTLGFSG